MRTTKSESSLKKETKSFSIKENYKDRVKQWIRKVKKTVSTIGIMTLIIIGVSGVHWNREVRFVLSNFNEISEWQNISPEIRQKALKVAQKCEKEIKIQKKKKIAQYFSEKEKKESSQKINLNWKRIPKEGKEVLRKVSAYNSLSHQTDGTPCIAEPTQNNLCLLYSPLLKEKGLYICATNAYELGTELEIRTATKKFGRCIVLDRMSRKYRERIDIFFNKDIKRAQRFGVQKLWVKPVGLYKNFERTVPPSAKLDV